MPWRKTRARMEDPNGRFPFTAGMALLVLPGMARQLTEQVREQRAQREAAVGDALSHDTRSSRHSSSRSSTQGAWSRASRASRSHSGRHARQDSGIGMYSSETSSRRHRSTSLSSNSDGGRTVTDSPSRSSTSSHTITDYPVSTSASTRVLTQAPIVTTTPPIPAHTTAPQAQSRRRTVSYSRSPGREWRRSDSSSRSTSNLGSEDINSDLEAWVRQSHGQSRSEFAQAATRSERGVLDTVLEDPEGESVDAQEEYRSAAIPARHPGSDRSAEPASRHSNASMLSPARPGQANHGSTTALPVGSRNLGKRLSQAARDLSRASATSGSTNLFPPRSDRPVDGSYAGSSSGLGTYDGTSTRGADGSFQTSSRSSGAHGGRSSQRTPESSRTSAEQSNLNALFPPRSDRPDDGSYAGSSSGLGTHNGSSTRGADGAYETHSRSSRHRTSHNQSGRSSRIPQPERATTNNDELFPPRSDQAADGSYNGSSSGLRTHAGSSTRGADGSYETRSRSSGGRSSARTIGQADLLAPRSNLANDGSYGESSSGLVTHTGTSTRGFDESYETSSHHSHRSSRHTSRHSTAGSRTSTPKVSRSESAFDDYRMPGSYSNPSGSSVSAHDGSRSQSSRFSMHPGSSTSARDGSYESARPSRASRSARVSGASRASSSRSSIRPGNSMSAQVGSSESARPSRPSQSAHTADGDDTSSSLIYRRSSLSAQAGSFSDTDPDPNSRSSHTSSRTTSRTTSSYISIPPRSSVAARDGSYESHHRGRASQRSGDRSRSVHSSSSTRSVMQGSIDVEIHSNESYDRCRPYEPRFPDEDGYAVNVDERRGRGSRG